MTWSDLMREWNQQCEPKEKYSHVSNFRRDAPPARERLLYRGAVRPTGLKTTVGASEAPVIPD
jgi:hypothetical protein